ncbi:hypothetical protein [Pelagibacterium halotolerans]|uniref:hypothetical protein n=1 Tax=Pelagibacterium halotolerans TaxID=531813 RepID=UPI00384F89E9
MSTSNTDIEDLISRSREATAARRAPNRLAKTVYEDPEHVLAAIEKTAPIEPLNHTPVTLPVLSILRLESEHYGKFAGKAGALSTRRERAT